MRISCPDICIYWTSVLAISALSVSAPVRAEESSALDENPYSGGDGQAAASMEEDALNHEDVGELDGGVPSEPDTEQGATAPADTDVVASADRISPSKAGAVPLLGGGDVVDEAGDSGEESALSEAELDATAADGEINLLDLELEQLLDTPVEVWTATKTKSTINEAPAVMTVITREEIRRYGYRSVADALQQVLGFYVIDDHIVPNLGVRGISGGFMGESSSVKVMVDGYSVAFRATSGNWLGPELMPMSAVERIEIIRGPASALYGADAFLGVVNIITIKGENLSLGTIQGGGGITAHKHYGHDFDAAFGTRYKSVDIMLALRSDKEDRSGIELPSSSPAPQIPYYNIDDKEASGLQLESKVLHGRIIYHIKNRHQISLHGHLSEITRGGEFSPWSQISYGLDDAGRQRGTVINLYQGMVGLHAAIVPTDKLTLDWRLAYFKGGPQDGDTIDLGSGIYTIEREFGYDSVETSLEGRWRIREDFTAVVGAEFIYDMEDLPSSLRVISTSVSEADAGSVIEDSSERQGTESLYNIGAFAQAMWTAIDPYLDLTGGFRYDNHSLYGNQFSGRVGATSRPMDMLFLKALYGAAFKAPSPLLLYGVPHQVGDIIGNPDLEPQRVHTVEGQAILKPWKFLSLSTGVAYNLLYDKAEFVQQGNNRVAANLSKMKSISSESEITAAYKEWLTGTVGFEYQWTVREFEKNRSVYFSYLVGDKNVVYPQYILRLGITGRIPKVPLRPGIRLMYVGPRPSSEMNALENLAMYDLESYLLLNATISTVGIELVDERKTTFSLIGRNLTNTKVADPGYAGVDYPLAPLTVMFQIRQEL